MVYSALEFPFLFFVILPVQLFFIVFVIWIHKKLSKNCQVNSSLWHFLSSSVSYSEVWVPPPNIVETPATGKYLMWVCHCEDNWKNFTPIHSMPSIWTEKNRGRVRELIILVKGKKEWLSNYEIQLKEFPFDFLVLMLRKRT